MKNTIFKLLFKTILSGILILLFFYGANPISAQNTYGKVTPQTSDFIKYGAVPVSLFTGKFNFEGLTR